LHSPENFSALAGIVTLPAKEPGFASLVTAMSKDSNWALVGRLDD